MIRRSFIQKTGALAGGMLLHNEMLQAFALEADGGKIKVGIIGCGDRGRGLMQVMNELVGNFQVVALCDVLDFRLKEIQKNDPSAKWKFFKDYRKLLDDKNVQAVIIATPLHLHYQMAIDALAAGKHV